MVTMKAILTSSLGGQVKIDGKRLPAKLPETNGLLKCIKDVWKKRFQGNDHQRIT